jgi:hypothetical protein
MLRLYNPHDVVLQRENMGIWWMSGPFEGDRGDFELSPEHEVLAGLCVLPSSDGSWEVGDLSPFDVEDDYDETAEVIGHCETFEQARAIAALAGLEGFNG